MAAEAPAALRAEEGCNPPPAIRPDTPGAGIAGVIAGIIAEIIPGIITAFTRHLRGIYAAVFPLLQGTTHTASGRGIHIDEKRLPHKQPETEVTPAGVCSGRGEIVKSDLPDSPSVICSLPCSALPGTPGASIGYPIHADGARIIDRTDFIARQKYE